MKKLALGKTALISAFTVLAATLAAPSMAATPQAAPHPLQAKVKKTVTANRFADDSTQVDDGPLDEDIDFQDFPDVFDDPALAFEPVYDALPGSWIESGFFEVTGLSAPQPISIVGGEYSMDEGDYTAAPSEVVNGAWIKVSLLTPDDFGATATAQLKIGDQVYTFQAVNITETDLASLDDMFEESSSDLQLVGGEVLLEKDIAAPLVIKDNTLDNVLFKMKNGVDTDIDNTSGTANLKFHANDDSDLETVAYFKADGKRSTLMRLMRGNTDVNFDAANSLLPINDPGSAAQKGSFTALNGTPSSKVEIQSDQRKTRQTKPTEEDVYEAWVKEGSANIQQIGSSGTVRKLNSFAAANSIYAGETASFSRQGDLRQIRLGSLKGDQNLAGDPLPLDFLAHDTKVPNLEGNVSRLQGATLLAAVKSSLDAKFGGTGGISFDETRGLVTYTLAGKIYRFIPLGSALVNLPVTTATVAARSRSKARLNRFAASNAGSTAAGAFNLAAQGIQLTMAGTLGYFSDLDKAVKAIDPAGKLQLQVDGVIRIAMGGADYVVIPASEVTPTNVKSTPAFLFSGPSGLAFRDRDGGLQTLFAATGDISALLIAARQFDPKAAVVPQPDGTVQVALLGASFQLKPRLKLSAPPADKAQLNLWQENNSIFLRYPDGKVQGFDL
ncbi:MAG: hypothetical protein KGZ83_15380 [Sulfuricella sp.]|nr:hypothetical protein [Sulfuricella sp.]